MAVALALQAVVWAALIPLFTAHVGYGLHDLSDVAHYLAQAERVDLGEVACTSTSGSSTRRSALPAAILALPRGGTLAAYEYRFSLEMIGVCCASAVVVAITAAKMWRGVGRPFAATVAFARRRRLRGCAQPEPARPLWLACLAGLCRRWRSSGGATPRRVSRPASASRSS